VNMDVVIDFDELHDIIEGHRGYFWRDERYLTSGEMVARMDLITLFKDILEDAGYEVTKED